MFDDAKYDEVVAGANSVAAAGGVIEVRDHFAGYFDELGLWIKFGDDASDRHIISIGNQLLAYLSETLPLGNPHFRWVLSLERGSATLDVLLPGEQARDPSASLIVLK